VSFQLFALRHTECFAPELSALLVVAYRFFFRCVFEHFFLESVDTLHLVDGLDALPFALCSVLEDTANLNHTALGVCVPHWRVSGPSFYALLLLPQWRPFGLDAVRTIFLPFFMLRLHKLE